MQGNLQPSNSVNTQPNFAMALNQDVKSINNMYTNARYAPVGNQKVGLPFPAYKEFGGRFTQWQPTSLSASTTKKQMNLPTANNAFRLGFEQDAIGLGNESLKDWTYSTQALSNVSFDTMFCTSKSDCTAYGDKYSCNPNYEPWPDSHGNQSGSVCSLTRYPEIDSGVYIRKNVNQGGIGKACKTNADCGETYECNNSVDFVGKNVQQTGYCSQTYDCQDGIKRYMGYPYNSGIPQPPAADQNKGGQGYRTKQECNANANPQQDCVQLNGAYFATYPGFCPVPTNLRKGSPQGALRTTSAAQKDAGFTIPAYATNSASNTGGSGKAARAFSAWNIQSNISQKASMAEPLAYSLSINPRPPNQM